MAEKTRPMSQATIIGRAPPTTWVELCRDCCDVFGGGHRNEPEELRAFHHGMQTVFNLLEAEMPTLAEVRAVPALVEAVEADAIAEIAESRARRMQGGPMRDVALEEAGRLRGGATLARDAALAAVEKGGDAK